MAESASAIFDRLNGIHEPENPVVHLDRAVVLGGSIAGLMAARVLADHAKNVVIIERDEQGAELNGTARAGVPQGQQVHVLLPGGRAQLDRWFPGLTRQAVDEGAVLCSPQESAFYTDGVQHIQTSNPAMLNASRVLLEALIRRRVLGRPNVEVVTGQATGLAYADGAVSQVRYRTADGERAETTDFVVDAMGRATKLPDWLGNDDWDRPVLERMPANVNYATAFFKRGGGQPPVGLSVVSFGPRFPDRTRGVAIAVENGRWMVLLAGLDDNRPGRTEEDFLTACAGLPPIFGEAVRGELVSEIRTYHHADSRRRTFSGLQRYPARLISVGDAVASFNPIYGQGMSSAALHASCLSEYLHGNPDLSVAARDFFALQEVVVDAAWEISTSADAVRLGDPRKSSARVRLQRWILDQILAATVVDEKIASKFSAVTYMTAHPSSLARPGTIVRAVAAGRRRKATN